MSFERGKYGKLTAEALTILQHEASIRMQRTNYKELARKTGLSPGHVAKVIWRLMHGNKYSVPARASQSPTVR